MKTSELRKTMVASNEFYTWKNGENHLRFVSEVVPTWKAFAGANNPTQVYLTAKAASGIPDVRSRFVVYAIDRDTGAIQQCEFGLSVMNQILDLSETTDYHFEDVPGYDFTIKKTGEGMKTEYSVVPARQDSALTEEEKAQIASLEALDMVIAKEAVDAEAYKMKKVLG